MYRSGKGAFALAVLAALLAAPHFYALESLHRRGPELLVLQFYFVVGAAVGLLLLLFITGRFGELSIFKRRETRFLLLAAAGGYGFWILSGLALESAEPARARLLFYTAPLWMVVLGAFGRERADGRIVVGLLFGALGCIMITRAQQWTSGSGAALWSLPALGAGVCWAVFSLLARPVMQEGKALPAAALVTGVGAVCIFVTCLSMKVSILGIAPAQLARAMVWGFFMVGVMMALWLKCLAEMPVAMASPFWYCGMVFGLWWAIRDAAVDVSGWWALPGVVIVLLSIFGAVSRRERPTLTVSDLIRG